MTSQSWFFYNLGHSIDEEKPFDSNSLPLASASAGTEEVDTPGDSNSESCESSNETSPQPLDSHGSSRESSTQPTSPVYSRATLRRSISPCTKWIAFNPSDNYRLCAAQETNDPNPVDVGHERQLFEVVNLKLLRPIYWSSANPSTVCRAEWVFQSTLTPVDPTWAVKISQIQGIIPETKAYIESLRGSLANPRALKALTSHIEVTQGETKFILDVLFSTDGTRAYLFTNCHYALTSRSTVESLLNDTTPRGVVETVVKFDWSCWKKLHKIPDRPSDDINYVPAPLNRLILVFHGIGQKLSQNFSRLNFVYAIDRLRVLVAEAARHPSTTQHFSGPPVRFLVLAVNWRSGLEFDVDYSLDNIMAPFLKTMRLNFSNVMLDIPLYMSSEHRPRMLNAAAKEANRLYELALKHNPQFLSNGGRVNLVGHSLGSLITADLLTHQPTVYDCQPTAPFHFNCDNYFTTGSMLGLFLLLKNSHLSPRTKWDAQHPDSSEKPPFGCFAARNVYNLINESDMLCYLLGPTVGGLASKQPIDPAIIPSAKSMVCETGSKIMSTSSLTTSIASHPSIGKLSSYYYRLTKTESASSDNLMANAKDSTGAPENNEAEEESMSVLEHLNENGQLDWSFNSGYVALGGQYIKLFTAHFEYWSNPDLARFLAIECGRDPGQENTVPEHRSQMLIDKLASKK